MRRFQAHAGSLRWLDGGEDRWITAEIVSQVAPPIYGKDRQAGYRHQISILADPGPGSSGHRPGLLRGSDSGNLSVPGFEFPGSAGYMVGFPARSSISRSECASGEW